MHDKKEYTFGEKVGSLIFLQEDFTEKELTGRQRYRKALFQCDCGQKILTRISGVVAGKVNSCGCVKRNKLLRRITKHGMSNTPEYLVWDSIKGRCFCKSSRFYCNYGGRGITMCEEWRNNFIKFYEYMGKKPSEKHSIERIDVNGNYEPGNCRWATRFEQDRNKRNSVFIEYNGQKKVITDWAVEYNLHAITIRGRLRRGMTPEEAFTKPTNYNKKNELLLQI